MASTDDAGWKRYAPTNVQPPANCSFCGEPQDEAQMLIVAGDGKAAICEHCVSSHSLFFERRRSSPSS